MKALVTVLMAVYNGEAYIKAAIQSVLDQTFPDFELLIINDGSTDNTVALIEAYNDPRIRLVHNEMNLGLTRSLNKGLDLSEGKYIARLDGDDIALPDRLRLQFNFLEAHETHGLIGGERQLLQNGQLRNKPGELFADHEAICVHQLFRNGFVHSAVMMRTDTARTLRYNESIFAAQDYDLWVRFSQHCQVANLLQPVVRYRIHAESISETKLHRQIETFQQVQRAQLETWGVAWSPEELHTHLLIGLTFGGHEVTEKEVADAAHWLLKLKQHNQSRPRYDEKAMNLVFNKLWQGLFNRKANRVPLRYLWKNWNHPLNRSPKTRMIIFIHCLKHYPMLRSLRALLKL